MLYTVALLLRSYPRETGARVQGATFGSVFDYSTDTILPSFRRRRPTKTTTIMIITHFKNAAVRVHIIIIYFEYALSAANVSPRSLTLLRSSSAWTTNTNAHNILILYIRVYSNNTIHYNTREIIAEIHNIMYNNIIRRFSRSYNIIIFYVRVCLNFIPCVTHRLSER